jgi:hypothetical protein
MISDQDEHDAKGVDGQGRKARSLWQGKYAWPPASLPELGEDGQRAGQRRLRH